MKREYRAPKVKLVNFSYDEQVVAASIKPNVSGYGDPNYTGYCQQSSPYTCTKCFLADLSFCEETAWSLRK